MLQPESKRFPKPFRQLGPTLPARGKCVRREFGRAGCGHHMRRTVVARVGAGMGGPR